MSLFSTIINQLFNGLQSGSIYALIALGYSMVYGIIMLLNFAHGDIIMVGAYVIWAVFTLFAGIGNAPPIIANLSPFFGIIAAIVSCTVLGMLIEVVAYKPLRKTNRLSLLITAIGVSMLLENLAQMIFGAGAKPMPVSLKGSDLRIGDIYLSFTAIVTIVVSLISMILLRLLIRRTKMGKAMRAVSEDMDAAQLMGINVNKVISYTFAIGSALAAIGAVLYCEAYPQASPTMGSMLGLKAFVAAVLGGIGSIPGAMIGGFAIGIIESLVSAVGLSVWKEGVVFAILIIMLLVKPAGIMGKQVQEKV